jgi:hypothetical protein
MRVIYRQAEQGHIVPQKVLEPRGPFKKYEPVVTELGIDPDAFPPGATAQNNMAEVLYFECSLCHAVIREDATAHHECGGM